LVNAGSHPGSTALIPYNSSSLTTEWSSGWSLFYQNANTSFCPNPDSCVLLSSLGGTLEKTNKVKLGAAPLYSLSFK